GVAPAGPPAGRGPVPPPLGLVLRPVRTGPPGPRRGRPGPPGRVPSHRPARGRAGAPGGRQALGRVRGKPVRGSPVGGSPVRGRPVRGRPVLGPGRRGSAMTARTVPGRPAPDQGQRSGVPLLEVADLKTYYPVRLGLTERLTGGRREWVHAVDGVSFSLARGEKLALVGESGCGKTSTAQTILRMIEPTSGTIRLNGTDITGLSQQQMRPLRRKLQMIYQDPYESLDPRFRVQAAVEEPMLVHGLGGSRAARRDLVIAALERAGL